MQIKKITKEKKNFFTFNIKPSTIISFRYVIIALIITLALAFIIPKVFNYGAGTINTPFDLQMSYVSYTTQFVLLGTTIILAIIIVAKLLLKDVDSWYVDQSSENFFDIDRIKKMREKCLSLPYLFFAIEMFLPFIITILVLSITGSHSNIMIGKILIILQSFAFLLAVVSFISSKDIYDEILSKTYVEGFDIGVRISLGKRVFLLIFPIILAIILFTSLLGYSASIIEKEEALFYIYKTHLNNYFNENQTYSLQEINQILKTVPIIDSKDTIFLLAPNDRIQIVKGNSISTFLIEYTKQLSSKNGGRLYDSYGVDKQGYSMKLKTDIGDFYVGILFEVQSSTSLVFLGINGVSLITISIIILYIFGNSLSRNIHQISVGFEKIADNTDTTTLLPVISNDEIGDLIQAFNAIQQLNTKQLQTIQDNQEMMIEKERLATLGQMIGGIAHNLKTPIFSISGATEGIQDLIKEYKESITDPSVTVEDHLSIAKDMEDWIDKIKKYTSYMSDVITAVRGQAVAFAERTDESFTIEELVKNVLILMKHELQKSLTTLNTNIQIDQNFEIKGNINSLVQVINNLISNAIQAYTNEQNKIIDFSIFKDRDKIIFSVKDYGCGMNEEVQRKLFKEMITTKGKNGTGLGLFMSYSNIKAQFNGEIKFTSVEGNGTTFNIIIPIKGDLI